MEEADKPNNRLSGTNCNQQQVHKGCKELHRIKEQDRFKENHKAQGQEKVLCKSSHLQDRKGKRQNR